MAKDPIRGVDAEEADTAKSRTRRLVELFQRQSGDEHGSDQGEANALVRFAGRVQQLNQASASVWSSNTVRQLVQLVKEAILQATKQAATMAPDNPHAQSLAIDAARSQLLKLAVTLNPPPGIVDSADFQDLMAMLKASVPSREETEFSRHSLLQGRVRSDVLNRQVHDAVLEADQRAADKRVGELRRAGADQLAIKHAMISLAQLARALRKQHAAQKKRAGAEVDESGVPVEVADVAESEISIADVEELAALGLEVMRMLREEIAPRWAPHQQPWLLNATDKEVYDIILATVPRELFEETQAYQQMQELRAQQQVFSLRAADKTTEALRRK